MRLEQLSTEIKLLHVSIPCRYIPAYTFLSLSSLTSIFSKLCSAKNNCPMKLSPEIHVGFYSTSHNLVDYHLG